MAAVRSLAHASDRLLRSVAMVALFMLAAVIAIDVVGRTFFDSPLGFTFELAGVLLGIAVYAGLFGTNWRRDHVKIDLFADAFSRSQALERWRDGFSLALEMVFFGILAAAVLRQTFTLARWDERFFFLPFEKWVPMALFFALLCLSVAVFVARLLGARHEDEQAS